MSDLQPPLKIPRDVWNMISHAASTDKVYVVTIKSSTSSSYKSEIGVFKDQQEAYKIASNIMGNYYLGCCIEGGHCKGFERLYKFMYFNQMPENSVFNVKEDETVEYPKDYVTFYDIVQVVGKSAGIQPKIYVEIIEKQVI